jgi:hypothetical protein
MKHLILRGLGVALLLSASVARAEGGGKVDGYLSLTVPRTLKNFSPIPQGFRPAHIAPPVLFALHVDMNAKDNLTPFFGFKTAFTQFSQKPFWGLDAGLLVGVKQFKIGGGGEFNTQGSLERAPYDNSQFDTTFMVLKLLAEADLSLVTVKASYRYIDSTKSRLGSFEGIKTEIARKQIDVLTVGAAMDLWLLNLEAFASYYRLPATAILSDDFSFGIAAKDVYKFSAGAGLDLGPWTLWARYSYVTGVSDSLAHFYQSPMLMTDYLLAKSVGEVELRWNF